MLTCPLAQFLLLALPKSALHAEILMLRNGDIADEMLVGEYLRAPADQALDLWIMRDASGNARDSWQAPADVWKGGWRRR